MNTINNFIKSSLLSLFVAVVALVACTPQATMEEPSVIEVASDAIQLPKEAGEKIIDVKSNKEQLVAVSNRDWVTATPQEGSIKLVYDENSQITARKATIIIQAGDAVHQVTVTQEGSPIFVQTAPENIVLDPWEYESEVSVRLNGDKWTVSSSEEWLKVTAFPWKNQIKLSVANNKGGEDNKSHVRTAELLFQVEGVATTATITVTQKEWPLFMLPFIDFEFGTKSIVTAFELERKSMVAAITGSKFIDFNTISPFISRMSYVFSTRGVLEYAQMDVSEPYKRYNDEGDEVMLPFIDFEFGTKSIVTAFELERKSMVAAITGSKFIDFNTISPFISRMSYVFSTRGVLEYAQMDVSEPYKRYNDEGDEVMLDEAYDIIIKGLTDAGFTEKRGENQLYHPEKRVLAEVKRKYASNPHVLYSYIPKQKVKYPTFEKFPYPEVPFGSDYAKVETYEANNGGVYDASTSQYDTKNNLAFIAYKVPKSKQIKYRNYFFTYKDEKPGEFVGIMQEWYDFNLVYYENNGHFYMTEEFTALMEKEGFKYRGKTDDKNQFDFFVNDAKGLLLKVKFAHFEGAEDPSLVLFMQPYHSGKSSQKLSLPMPKQGRVAGVNHVGK